MANSKAIGAIIGVGALIGLAFAAKGQSNTSTDTATDPVIDSTTGDLKKKPAAVKPNPTVPDPLWRTWAKKWGGPEAWWKQCYDKGYSESVSQILVVLRNKKDLGYKPGVLVQHYDDASRIVYLKWAVRKAASIGLDFKTVPALYLKAFNQDVRKQYSNTTNLWDLYTFSNGLLKGFGSPLSTTANVLQVITALF